MKEAQTRKHLLAIIVCVITALLCTVPASSALGKDDILTVGVPINRCPISYQEASTGEVVGIGVDLMRAAAEEAGYTAVFEPIKEGLPREAIDSGAYDVAMPFTNNLGSASGQPIVVSDELIQMPFTLVTVKDRGLSSQTNIKMGMQRTLSATANTVKELYPALRSPYTTHWTNA